jgi:hypothetical protein
MTKRKTLLLMALAALAIDARATLPVIDGASITNNTVHHALDYVQYVNSAVKNAQTALNTLHSYQEAVIQVSRMGDMSALKNLPGIGTVAELAGTTGQLYRDYQQLQSVANPQNYQSDMARIMGNYNLPTWQGFLAANGTQIAPSQNLYQFDTARWNLANKISDTLQQLQQKRKALQQQRDQVAKLHESATTQAEQAKYAAQRDSLDQAIAQVDQQVHQAMAQNALQGQRINAAQQISQNAQFERNAAAQLQSIDNDPLNSLPSANFRGPVHFNSN